MGIAVEEAEQEAGVTGVDFESLAGPVGFRGLFLVLAAQPPQHRREHQLERTVGTSIRLSSFRSRGHCRVASVRRGK